MFHSGLRHPPPVPRFGGFHTPLRHALILIAILLLWTAQLIPAVAQSAPDPASPAAPELADFGLEDLLELRIAKVYSASKYEQFVTQAPAAVTLVTADEIKQYGHRSLADVLQSVRGMYVSTDRNYSYVGVRGFSPPGDYNSRILLLVDGHATNDSLYDAALIGTEGLIDIDLVERVEVIRGPSSSIYGKSAFFGVINVITRQSGDIDGVEVSATGGTFETFKTRITFGHDFASGVGLVLSGTFYDSAGPGALYFKEFDAPETNHGVAENAAGDQAQHWLARLFMKNLTFSAVYSRRDKDVPTATFGTVFNDDRFRTTDQTFFADLKYDAEISADWRALARVYYDHYSYLATYPYDYAEAGGPPDIYLDFEDDYAEDVGAELQLTGRLLDRHTIILGAAYRHSLHLQQAYYYAEDFENYGFYLDKGATSAGLYAQGEFKLNRKLLLNAGVRFDHFSESGGTTNPRLGLIYQPTPAATFKLLYGTAFREPNSFEADYDEPGYAKANHDLRPEGIQTLELVYEQYLRDSLLLSFSGYQYRINDLITQETDASDGLVTFNNQGGVTARGVEIELEGRFPSGLHGRVSYALQRADDTTTGASLSNSPRQMAKFNVSLPLVRDQVFASLEMQYLGRLETLVGNYTDASLVANATLSGRLLDNRLELSASIYNLFDEDYAFPGSTGHSQDTIPQNGRSYLLKCTYRF